MRPSFPAHPSQLPAEAWSSRLAPRQVGFAARQLTSVDNTGDCEPSGRFGPSARIRLAAALGGSVVLVAALAMGGCADTAPGTSTSTTIPDGASGPDSGAKFDGGEIKAETAVGNPDAAGSACKTPADCNDGNPCTDDFCASLTCKLVPNKAPCDDGNPSTSNDICGDAKCAGKGGPVTTDAGGTDTDTGSKDTTPTPDTAPIVGPDLKEGQLIINEIMYNPYGDGKVSDDSGEWVELYNPADKPIDLTGLVIKSAGDSVKFIVPTGVTIGAKGFAVFGTKADEATNGGVKLAAAWGTVIKLTNSIDGVSLESNGVHIDTVAYDVTKGWSNLNGVALSLAQDQQDGVKNDSAEAWCGATSVMASADKGTPGAANDKCQKDTDKDGVPDDKDNCPTIANSNQFDTDKNGIGDVCEGPVPTCGNKVVDSGEGCDDGNKQSGDGCSAWCQLETTVVAGGLVITEIMYNPAQVEDDVGEWIELYNPGAAAVTLNGVILQTGTLSPIQHIIEGPAAIVVEPKGFALLALSADPAINGGLPKPNYVYGKLILSSTAATLSIWSGGKELDKVAYGPSWPLFTGKSLAVDPTLATAATNDGPQGWCKGQATYGKGDYGSPGATNPSCSAASEDEDKDGVADKADNCLEKANPDQLDNDADSVGNACDNCADVTNTTQTDTDGDGKGDACEDPGCGNGVVESGENCDDGNTKFGDGCSTQCQLETPIGVGYLMITELLPDPSTVTDDLGEWLEIYNASTTTVELAGLGVKIGTVLKNLPSDKSYPLAAGGYAVVARNGNSTQNGGIDGAIVLVGMAALGNSAALEVRLEVGAKVIDTVTYSSAGWLKVSSGVALALDPSSATVGGDKLNDNAALWCYASTPFGKGDKGTPGKANAACPKDSDGDGALDGVDNCPLAKNTDQKDGDKDGIGDLCDNCPTIPNADQSDDNGDGKGNVCQDLADPVCGNGIIEAPETCDDSNTTGGDGCSAKCQKEGASGGIAVGDLVISEIMMNGNGGAGDVGEWFEIANVSGKDLDLKGITIAGKPTDKPIEITLSLPLKAGEFAVFGPSADLTKNGGYKPVQTYTQSGFPLSNDVDTITIKLGAVVIDSVSYDTGAKWPAVAAGKAVQLSGDKMDATKNDVKESWCHATAKFGDKAYLGTPGMPNTVCGAAVLGSPAKAGWSAFYEWFYGQ
ncbi:MAG: DUF4215 domain-containing protein [Myxococcales bacterium]|nr:DUF4215 domain-containing protein [Myxococcales bacterium]